MKGATMRRLMLVAVLLGGLWGCDRDTTTIYHLNGGAPGREQDDDKPACGELAKTKGCEK